MPSARNRPSPVCPDKHSDFAIVLVTSQGVQTHLVQAWHDAGYSGKDVKIGIIDSGFEGFSDLIGTELAAVAGARCYSDIGQYSENLADCEGEGVSLHGTAVAETIVDIAPEASIYLAQPISHGDLRETVDWMVSQGVSVINRSLSSFFDGPGDGKSPNPYSPLNTVNHAVDRGIIWANSAGNHARGAWFQRGPYSDSDGDGVIEFDSGDETNYLFANEGQSIVAQLRWEDSWGGASSDFDLFLVHHDSRQIVARSIDSQTGDASHVPHESVRYEAPVEGNYYLAVTHESGSIPDWIQLLVYRLPIEHATGNGSITNPGESNNPGLLAVGATHYWDTNTIASYSGRGPTPDSRPKPDIVGTACAATVSYQPSPGSICWFAGTSQASPHVAGMAALVRQRFPDYIPVQVATYLKDYAERRGTVPNNTWGHGFAVLPPIGGCSNNPGLAADCAMLLAARDTLAGTGTLNWSANAPITTWDGVTMGGSPLRVTKIRLSDKGLTGEIPSELGSLANLQVLHLTRNQLTGPIPAELGGLTNLSILALGGNELTGGITTELGRLSKLERLYLWGNQLSGEIPPQLGNLASLTELHLDENQLTGEIPTELGELTNLARLALNDNQLTGSIPPTLSNLAKLEELHLTRNQLAGPIPPELGGLVKLSILALGGNGLIGEIPGRLGDLTNLTELFLWGNQLTGEIPEELGSLTNLTVLDVSDNQLTGTIPTRLGGLTDLEELSLWGNQLSGQIPSELGNLAKLERLYVSRNQLTGEIPAELGSLASLEKLWLHENQLSGQIPSELGNLANLALLSLSRNNLTGEIPAELGNLASLEELYLWDNQLTGEIPPELSRLTNLETLGLSGNQLTGEIPAESGNLSSLVGLDLSDNQLTGTIPPELGDLANLERLYLFDNQLTGTIPTELGGLTNLAHLRLDGNQLTGEIPAELGRLANLTLLHLSGNQLTGCVPDSLRDVADNDFAELRLTFCPSDDPPGVTVSHAGTDPAAPVRVGTAIPVAATFTKTVTGFTVDDVTVDNASVGNFLGSAAAYTFDVTPNAIGQVTVDIAANVAQDADGNGNTAAAQLRLGIPYDDNRNGLIERSEVIKAINDYLGAGSVERSHVIALINFYLSSSGPGTPTGTPQEIVFAEPNWHSVQLQTYIARYMLEKGYGYTTKSVFGSSRNLLPGLASGDNHVMMEVWLPNQSESWEPALQAGQVLDLGTSLGHDWQSAFVIPAYLQEQYPELDSVEDLKEQRYKDLFQTTETDGKARLVSCVVGWLCESINADQVVGHGLDEHVHIVNPGSQDALFASINGAYQRREPWLGYMWGTGTPALLLDLVRLEEPPYSDECWETTRACAYEDATILIGAHSGLPDQAPDVAEFLKNWDFNIEIHLKNVTRWEADNPDALIEDTALYWLKNNVDVWSRWVTGEAADGILSALSQS